MLATMCGYRVITRDKNVSKSSVVAFATCYDTGRTKRGDTPAVLVKWLAPPPTYLGVTAGYARLIPLIHEGRLTHWTHWTRQVYSSGIPPLPDAKELAALFAWLAEGVLSVET